MAGKRPMGTEIKGETAKVTLQRGRATGVTIRRKSDSSTVTFQRMRGPTRGLMLRAPKYGADTRNDYLALFIANKLFPKHFPQPVEPKNVDRRELKKGVYTRFIRMGRVYRNALHDFYNWDHSKPLVSKALVGHMIELMRKDRKLEVLKARFGLAGIEVNRHFANVGFRADKTHTPVFFEIKSLDPILLHKAISRKRSLLPQEKEGLRQAVEEFRVNRNNGVPLNMG